MNSLNVKTSFCTLIAMKNPIESIKRVVKSLGLVEQSQVVASTAVVVSMATIALALIATGQEPRLMDLISIVAVGVIGFTGVFFSLQYSRQLDDQRRQLMALNAVAAAVNHFVELDLVLQTALKKLSELFNIRFGWIYMVEDDRLVLKKSEGISRDFFTFYTATTDSIASWLHQPRVQRERVTAHSGLIHPDLKLLGIQFWASIPLRAKDTVAGTLIVAGNDYDMFTGKEAELLEAFGNQISVALSNAQLFDRLRQSEQKYMDLFEQAPDIYLNINSQRVIVEVNATGAMMLGYAKRELIGKPLELLFVEERRYDVRNILQQMFTESRGLKDVEEQMVRKGGQTFFATLNSSLVVDEHGKTAYARIVARDISEWKKMEAAILHAQKIDSIGNLAGGIAHDFNNLLASVLGAASIMRRKLSENHDLYKYVEIIANAAHRGAALTRQLLTFARKTERDITTVDVNTIIKETLALFERSVTKEIAQEIHLTTDATSVSGDAGQIQQALLNLLLNSRDAMPDGGTLTVSSRIILADAHTTSQFNAVKPGPFVEIVVRDMGIGIDKTIQNRIFEPFFTTKDNGTGLGLAVLYGVVQNHGGFINLESEVGRGTTFSICLPRVATVTQSAIRQKRQRLPRGRENILVVDDEMSVCEIARDMLADLGYTVMLQHDGKAGVECYRSRQGSIDLILLDVNMPLMGGKQAFEELRSLNSNVRVIFLTGYGKDSAELATLPSGADGLLQKPFQVEDLAAKVRSVLDTRSVPQERPGVN
jgi:PAS domain S-box-containing protein